MLYRNTLLMLLFLGLSFLLQAQHNRNINGFIARLDTIRQELKIPGMAAAVMENDAVLFAKGFGYSNIKNKVKTTAGTSFRVASVTKTFTSTIIMQLVEQGRLDLNTPISKYGLDLGNPVITVKQLLTHTSEQEPGTMYQYNGYRFGQLGPIIDKAAGVPFFQLLMEKILKPAGMTASAPGIPLYDYFWYVQQRKDMKPFFERAFSHLATPYSLDAGGQPVETTYLNEFGAFGGLTTTVNDLLAYSRAIDKHQFITSKTQQQVFTPNRTSNRTITPYGLGWFTQQYKGIDFYWHYGQTQGESALFLKVPSRNLTFVVMANTDKLSQPFPLGDGDLFTSPLGQLFYRYFINDEKSLQNINYMASPAELKTAFSNMDFEAHKDFYNREIITHSVMDNISGNTVQRARLLELYADLNFKNTTPVPQGTALAVIQDVSVNQQIKKAFTLTGKTVIRVYGAGENCSSDLSSWCDYGWIEDSSGKIVWQMQGKPATHAGGAVKNQRVDMIIDLPAGAYTLQYKSDWAHAFNSWDSAPPDHYFWGIILFKQD